MDYFENLLLLREDWEGYFGFPADFAFVSIVTLYWMLCALYTKLYIPWAADRELIRKAEALVRLHNPAPARETPWQARKLTHKLYMFGNEPYTVVYDGEKALGYLPLECENIRPVERLPEMAVPGSRPCPARMNRDKYYAEFMDDYGNVLGGGCRIVYKEQDYLVTATHVADVASQVRRHGHNKPLSLPKPYKEFNDVTLYKLSLGDYAFLAIKASKPAVVCADQRVKIEAPYTNVGFAYAYGAVEDRISSSSRPFDFAHRVSTESGHSGSAILNRNSEVVAIHSAAQPIEGRNIGVALLPVLCIMFPPDKKLPVTVPESAPPGRDPLYQYMDDFEVYGQNVREDFLTKQELLHHERILGEYGRVRIVVDRTGKFTTTDWDHIQWEEDKLASGGVIWADESKIPDFRMPLLKKEVKELPSGLSSSLSTTGSKPQKTITLPQESKLSTRSKRSESSPSRLHISRTLRKPSNSNPSTRRSSQNLKDGIGLEDPVPTNCLPVCPTRQDSGPQPVQTQVSTTPSNRFLPGNIPSKMIIPEKSLKKKSEKLCFALNLMQHLGSLTENDIKQMQRYLSQSLNNLSQMQSTDSSSSSKRRKSKMTRNGSSKTVSMISSPPLKSKNLTLHEKLA
jgi:hypothetical protein